MPEEYTSRELGIMMRNGFKGVHKRQDITNGRIKEAEDDVSELREWKKYIMGGLAVLLFIFSLLIVPLTLQYFRSLKEAKSQADFEERVKNLEQVLIDNFEIVE